mgnify:CR=1 FL=1
MRGAASIKQLLDSLWKHVCSMMCATCDTAPKAAYGTTGRCTAGVLTRECVVQAEVEESEHVGDVLVEGVEDQQGHTPATL